MVTVVRQALQLQPLSLLGCFILLLKNRASIVFLCPWAPVQPVGRSCPCALRCCLEKELLGPLGRALPHQCSAVHGRQTAGL